jgi:hypothetical protein
MPQSRNLDRVTVDTAKLRLSAVSVNPNGQLVTDKNPNNEFSAQAQESIMNSQETPRSNRIIVEEINQPATPESGARPAEGKIDDLPQQEVSGKTAQRQTASAGPGR